MRGWILLFLLAGLAAAQPPRWLMSPLDMMQPWLSGDFAKSRKYYVEGDNQFSHRYRVDMELELAHYRLCSQILKDDSEKSEAGFAARRGRLLYQTGDLWAAEKVARKAGLKHGNRYDLHLSNTLGLINLARGHYAEAVRLFTARLKLPREPGARIDEPETILALVGAARAYVAMGNSSAAADNANRALQLSQNSWGQFSIPALDAMNALAEVRMAEHDFGHARELLEICIRERSKLYGGINPKIADTLETEARFNLSIGDGQNALLIASHATDLRQQIFGGPSLWSAQALLNKANIYAAAGALDQASRCYENAVSVLEVALGPDAPAVQHARARRDALTHHTVSTTLPAS